jgi:hypothetical protein
VAELFHGGRSLGCPFGGLLVIVRRHAKGECTIAERFPASAPPPVPGPPRPRPAPAGWPGRAAAGGRAGASAGQEPGGGGEAYVIDADSSKPPHEEFNSSIWSRWSESRTSWPHVGTITLCSSTLPSSSVQS